MLKSWTVYLEAARAISNRLMKMQSLRSLRNLKGQLKSSKGQGAANGSADYQASTYHDFVSYSTFTGDIVPPQSSTLSNEVTGMLSDDPQTYEEAMNRPDRDRWMVAMREEMRALEENHTWDLTTVPRDQKTIRNKWVFKTKRAVDGTIEWY